ncbi:MAG: EpsG family protein [Clostridia bacterium]|nr:EpsG family protein [Clostridia bacterium]
MAIYIILLIYILVLPFVIRAVSPNEQTLEKKVAFWGMLAVFLLLALKNTSVGIDTKGYEQQYYIARITEWERWNYVYFERGYIFLQKFFSKLDLSFGWFTALVYAFECFVFYKLIAKHSKDARFSLMFFVCYQFLVFSLSGLRQTLSMSICVLAFLIIERDTVFSFFAGIVLMLMALSIHSGTFAFIAVIFIWFLSKRGVGINLITTFVAVAAGILIRPFMHSFINENLRKTSFDLSFLTSGNVLFIVLLFMFAMFTCYMRQKNQSGKRAINISGESYMDRMILRLLLYTVIGQFIFSGSTIIRSVMYITIYIPAFFPGIIKKYASRSQTFIKMALGAVLLFIFLNYTLLPNQFELIPYKFFWQTT